MPSRILAVLLFDPILRPAVSVEPVPASVPSITFSNQPKADHSPLLSDKQKDCLYKCLKKDGPSLVFDAGGAVLLFTPEGAFSTIASLAVAGGATLNAAAHGDLTGVGIGVAGYHVAAFGPSLKNSGLGAIARRAGAAAVAASSVSDVLNFIKDYNSCMSH